MDILSRCGQIEQKTAALLAFESRHEVVFDVEFQTLKVMRLVEFSERLTFFARVMPQRPPWAVGTEVYAKNGARDRVRACNEFAKLNAMQLFKEFDLLEL